MAKKSEVNTLEDFSNALSQVATAKRRNRSYMWSKLPSLDGLLDPKFEKIHSLLSEYGNITRCDVLSGRETEEEMDLMIDRARAIIVELNQMIKR